MLSSITSALGRLFQQQEEPGQQRNGREELGRGDRPRAEHSPSNDQRQAQERDARDDQQYPRNRKDVYLALAYIQRASPHTLPAELLKVILYHADYDCIHYTAALDKQVNVIARSAAGAPVRPCIETDPVAQLGPSNHSDVPKGRIRSLHLKFTGRDQGWTSDPTTSSWSWFEIGKRRSGDGTVQQGPTLVHNAVAGRAWEDHEFAYHMDEELSQNVGEELRQWIEELEAGHRISLLPMAKYGGWQCRVLKASIDVEVEVWY